MYDELTTDLRRAANTWLAEEYKVCAEAVRYLLKESADAIEELSAIREEQKAQIIAMAAEDKPRWIPVTERLPLYGQDVLAVRTYGDGEKCQEVLMAHIAVWDEGTGEKWWNATNITHWMPLPEPPKEE